uniref:BTB domain-containing protein n=1 Tax=Panagrolaimus davidi TaxID=227884 RepID=A0A914PSL9_9BILA
MSAESIALDPNSELQMKRLKIFNAQDPETGAFDVVFDIDGEDLYAHQFMICPVSSTFNSMLSRRKSKEPIQIENHSYKDFKEFITFFYSGKCELTERNIESLINMAQFYCVEELKVICDEYLIEILDFENIYQMLQVSYKYSLKFLKQHVYKFISTTFFHFLKSFEFYGLEKPIVKEIVETNDKTKYQEELFEALYYWAENRAKKSCKTNNVLVLNAAIKKELAEFLPFIDFISMDTVFFIKFVSRKYYIFSDDDWDKILYARSRFYVQISDENGKKMKGELQCTEMKYVVDIIKSQKDMPCFTFRYSSSHFWNTKKQKPKTPSKLVKNKNIGWYLVLNSAGDISIKRGNGLHESDYLLAEMFAEDGFILNTNCKIEVY